MLAFGGIRETAMARRLALVTGASAGIGAAFARALAARGCDVALTARRTERLTALATEIETRHGVSTRVIAADLADPAAPAAILAALADRGPAPDILINNAGYGLPGTFAETTWADQAAFIQVMMTAPCELAHRVLPGMRARRYGRIVNVASLAGLLPGAAGHTLYAASKAFLIRFSQSLHLEAAASGVHVTALCPGFTYSEFHDANGTRDLVTSGTGRWMWQSAEAVVADGLSAVEANRPVHTPGLHNRMIAGFARLIPEGAALRLMASQGARIRKL
jgi:short-subunit dehydrogenase